MAGTGANFRDLGGLRTEDGHRVRRGVLFRGEFPYWLVGDGQPPAGLRTVVDLRRDEEISLEDVDWSRWGVARHRHSLASGTVPFAVAHSDSYLAAGEEQLAQTVRTVLEPGRLPAYFFCAAGKDRTGLLAIALLSLVGVSRAEILADFRTTGDGISSVLDRLRSHAYYRDLFGDRPLDDFLPLEESAMAVLDWLEQRGGARAWVLSAGVPEAWIDDFRRAVLEADGQTG